MGRFAERIVGDGVENQIGLAAVENLVRLARFEEKGVARFDGRGAFVVADLSAARDDVVEFPLRAVRVVDVFFF